MRRITCTLAAAAVTLLAALPTAGFAEPAGAGHTGGNGQGNNHFATEGPDAPGLAWMTDLGVDLADRVYENPLQIDGAGRILVQGRIEANSDETLNTRHFSQAVDSATGAVLWDEPTYDLSADCGAVATEDGRFIGQLERRSETHPGPESPLVAIDAATGDLLDQQSFLLERTCTSRVVMTGDLVLVPVSSGTPGIRAIDTSTTPWTQAWSYDAVDINDRPADSGRNDQIVLSADGATVYHVSVKDRDADPLVHRVHAIRTADGTLRSSADLPGRTTQSDHRRVIAVADGVVVSLDRCDGGGSGTANVCVAKVADDGVDLTAAWVARPTDADGDRAAIITLTDTGTGVVAGWTASTGHLYGLDLATGEVVFRRVPSSFSNNGRQLISDADGTLIHGTFGEDYLQAFDTAGNDVFTVAECSTSTPRYKFGEPMAVGGIADDGTLVIGNAADEFVDGTRIGETYVLVGLRDGADVPRGTCPTKEERVAGTSRIETAVEVSQTSFPQQDSATTVLLAVSSNYPDALAGGPLARKLDAPLLLTEKESLNAKTRAEIERLGATNVVLLGGPGALSEAVENELRSMNLTTERIAGTSRFETARLIGARVPATTVYVTEGAHADPSRGWADAVSVSGLAAFEQRPILMVTRDQAPEATLQGLRDHGATEIVIIGGTGAVSDATAAALADYNPGGSPEATIVRVAGTSRYATSVAVAQRAIAAGASTMDLWFATGLSFPDALTAGPAVARSGGVLVLVHGKDTAGGSDVYEFLAGIERDRIQRAWFVGGTGAITDEVASKISDTLGVQ